jgi:uncharacterized FlgJ-related protein
MAARGSNTLQKSFMLLLLSVILSELLSRIFKSLMSASSRNSYDTPNTTGIKVFEELKANGFTSIQAMFITAQAAHETANFTSNVFKNANNCFGFKYTGHPLETGEYAGYGVYKTLEDCVTRYRDYYKKKKYPETFDSAEAFIKTLKNNNYYEAPYSEYIKGVNHFLTVYFS